MEKLSLKQKSFQKSPEWRERERETERERERERDGAEVILGGNAFHARAAATGNARSPSEDRRVTGTTTSALEAKRSLWREWISDTSLKFSEMCSGREHDADLKIYALWHWQTLKLSNGGIIGWAVNTESRQVTIYRSTTATPSVDLCFGGTTRCCRVGRTEVGASTSTVRRMRRRDMTNDHADILLAGIRQRGTYWKPEPCTPDPCKSYRWLGLSRWLSSRNISSRFLHNFFIHPVQTQRETDSL